MITLGELKRMVEDMLVEADESTPVHFLHQPEWAFELSIRDEFVITGDFEDGSQVAYLVEDRQIGYAPSDACEQAGWR